MNSRGNAFVYILVAVALFGALTFALSGPDQEASTSDLDEGRAKVAANSIIAYATSAQNSITTLDRLGTGPEEIDFVLPSETIDFNAAPHLDKLFHPEGGGLSYVPLPKDAIFPNFASSPPEPGYYIGRFNNVEWTPSTAEDVIFTAFGINQAVCAELNLKITGVNTIPVFGVASRLVDVTHHSGSNDDLEIADCAYCEEKSTLCVEDSSGYYALYSILVAR